jgi:prephenate dehydratase
MTSFSLPPDPTVAFQGEPGAYSELAILEYFGTAARPLPCPTFDEVFSVVSQGEILLGMIPIENSLAGSIHRNYDLMQEHQLYIVGEYHLRVRHCLMSLPGVKREDVRRVFSHPQALAQCMSNLKRLGLEPVAQADTAGSARWLRETGDTQAAALASRRAAEVYGLQILAEDMEDNQANFTRFLALACQPLDEEPQNGLEYKTSIVFTLRNRPGALFRAMSVFALRDIDLTKIESRPLPGQPWEYIFYIDFAGHAASENCTHALNNLREYAIFVRDLGSYPRHLLK